MGSPLKIGANWLMFCLHLAIGCLCVCISLFLSLPSIMRWFQQQRDCFLVGRRDYKQCNLTNRSIQTTSIHIISKPNAYTLEATQLNSIQCNAMTTELLVISTTKSLL